GLVDVMAQKIQDVQAHGAMGHEFAVGDDVFQIARQTQLEEHHRVDAFLPALAIKFLRQGIEEVQVQGFFQSSVKVFFGNAFTQLKRGEHFFLVMLFSLHRPIYGKYVSCATGTACIRNSGFSAKSNVSAFNKSQYQTES